jgi:hypothetical protein
MGIEIINVFECENCDYKRFLLFGCDNYYPAGDLSDIVDTYDTLKEAKEAYLELDRDFKVIYDRIENKTYHLKT